MFLAGLPNELLLILAKHLGPFDLNNLIRAGKGLRDILTPLLYNYAVQDCDGMSALCWASRHGHEPLVRFLLDKGFEVNTAALDSEARDSTTTALICAAERGHQGVVRFLLSKGAHDVSGALIVAVYRGNMAVCRILLENGANADCWGQATNDTSSKPALHWAVRRPYPNETMIELLLENGADIDIMDGSGITPLDVAWSMHLNYIVKLLLENGAKNSVYINLGDIHNGHSLWQIF
ncbi:hypothetical protein Q9L58_004970 [Maublancomyces gigas]|uniref:Uncharacterized protein n=1 Tax=Discina gigas TaxID=1032678 RepID=A0ABR3GJE8_9PEZI